MGYHHFWKHPPCYLHGVCLWPSSRRVTLAEKKWDRRSEVQRFDNCWSVPKAFFFWYTVYVPNHWVQGKKNAFFARLPSSQSSKIADEFSYLEIMYTKIHEPSWITKHTVDPCVWWMTVNPHKKWNKWKKVHQHTNYINASWSAWFKIGSGASSRMMSGMISKKGWSSRTQGMGRHPSDGGFTGSRICILNHGWSIPVCFNWHRLYRSKFPIDETIFLEGEPPPLKLTRVY